MKMQTIPMRFLSLVALAGLAGVALTSRAETKVCPPPPGTPWGDTNVLTETDPGLQEDCWLGLTFATATENTGRGKFITVNGLRQLQAYNFNSGPQHDFVKVQGFKADGTKSCAIFDYTKNAQPATNTSVACDDTLYAIVEGWRN